MDIAVLAKLSFGCEIGKNLNAPNVFIFEGKFVRLVDDLYAIGHFVGADFLLLEQVDGGFLLRYVK